MHFVLVRKNGFKSIFSSILLSELNMGIDYIYNILDHEIPLFIYLFSLFLNAGYMIFSKSGLGLS